MKSFADKIKIDIAKDFFTTLKRKKGQYKLKNEEIAVYLCVPKYQLQNWYNNDFTVYPKSSQFEVLELLIQGKVPVIPLKKQMKKLVKKLLDVLNKYCLNTNLISRLSDIDKSTIDSILNMEVKIKYKTYIKLKNVIRKIEKVNGDMTRLIPSAQQNSKQATIFD